MPVFRILLLAFCVIVAIPAVPIVLQTTDEMRAVGAKTGKSGFEKFQQLQPKERQEAYLLPFLALMWVGACGATAFFVLLSFSAEDKHLRALALVEKERSERRQERDSYLLAIAESESLLKNLNETVLKLRKTIADNQVNTLEIRKALLQQGITITEDAPVSD